MPLLETGFFRSHLIISIFGRFQDPNCSLRHEVCVRGVQSKYVVAPLRRHILGCPWIDLRVRRMLALSLVLSKGRTTWVAWPPLGVRDYKKVQADYYIVWRGVLGANICAGPPEQILARVDALDATLARRVDWLQYLRRLLVRAPEALLAALQAEQGTVGSWHSQIFFFLGSACFSWLGPCTLPSSATLRLVLLHSFA